MSELGFVGFVGLLGKGNSLSKWLFLNVTIKTLFLFIQSVQINLYDFVRKELNLTDDKAAAFVAAVEEVVEQGFRNEKQILSTTGDIQTVRQSIHVLEFKVEQTKGDIYKAIFRTGLLQLISILGGVLAIVTFLH